MTPFVKISEYEWMGVCEHRAGVVARTGAKLKKIRKINGSKQDKCEEVGDPQSKKGDGKEDVGGDEAVEEVDGQTGQVREKEEGGAGAEG